MFLFESNPLYVFSNLALYVHLELVISCFLYISLRCNIHIYFTGVMLKTLCIFLYVMVFIFNFLSGYTV